MNRALPPRMARGLHRNRRWRHLALAAPLLAGAMLLKGCLYPWGGCDDPLSAPIVRMPSGTFSPAATAPSVQASTGPDGRDFPRGALGVLDSAGGEGGEGGEGGGGGAPSLPPSWDVIPSASLEVDRDAGLVIRRYLDEQGRQVEERYRITRIP